MNKKRIIVLGIFVILIMSFMLIVNVSLSKEEEYLNDQEVENLKFDGANIEESENETTYKVNVTNETKEDIEIKYIEIKIDEETLIGYVGNKIKGNETKEIVASIDKKINNIKNVEYKIVK